MDILGIVLMWLFNVLVSRLQHDLIGGDGFSLDNVTAAIETISNVTNIFAWIDVFVPVDFIITLALLTAVFYSYRFITSIVKYIIALFK